jgi:hypothetical protein
MRQIFYIKNERFFQILDFHHPSSITVKQLSHFLPAAALLLLLLLLLLHIYRGKSTCCCCDTAAGEIIQKVTIHMWRNQRNECFI